MYKWIYILSLTGQIGLGGGVGAWTSNLMILFFQPVAAPTIALPEVHHTGDDPATNTTVPASQYDAQQYYRQYAPQVCISESDRDMVAKMCITEGGSDGVEVWCHFMLNKQK